MEIINGWKEMEVFAGTFSNNTKLKRFLCQGELHKGHHHIINDIKKTYPDHKIVVQYQGLFPVLRNYLLFGKYVRYEEFMKEPYYMSIINSAKSNPNIDYLVLNKAPIHEKLLKIFSRVKYDLETYMIPFCNDRNLNNAFAVECMYIHVIIDPIRKKLEFLNKTPFETYSSKYVLQALIHQRVFGYRYIENYHEMKNSTIWKFIKDNNGLVITRSGGVNKLSFIKNMVVDELNKGVTNCNELFNNTYKKYIIAGRAFTVIDLHTLDVIPEINNNCVIVIMSLTDNDFIVIKEGELIY